MCSIRKFWVRCNIAALPRELSRANLAVDRLPNEVNDTNTVLGWNALLRFSLTGGQVDAALHALLPNVTFMFTDVTMNSVDWNRAVSRHVAAALIHRKTVMIRLATATPLVALAALGLAVSGCGTTMEQKAATGAVAGAVVAGPVGAAVGGVAGAVMARDDRSE